MRVIHCDRVVFVDISLVPDNKHNPHSRIVSVKEVEDGEQKPVQQ